MVLDVGGGGVGGNGKQVAVAAVGGNIAAKFLSTYTI